MCNRSYTSTPKKSIEDEEIGHTLRRINRSAQQEGALGVIDALTEDEGTEFHELDASDWMEFVEAVHNYVNESSGVYVLEFKPEYGSWSVDSVHLTTTSMDARMSEVRDVWDGYTNVQFRWNNDPHEIHGRGGE